jgi:hypothetical protein
VIDLDQGHRKKSIVAHVNLSEKQEITAESIRPE